MTLVLLIHEDKNNIQEIQIHINDVHKILGGKVTFVGQWPEIDVVIIRAVHTTRAVCSFIGTNDVNAVKLGKS